MIDTIDEVTDRRLKGDFFDLLSRVNLHIADLEAVGDAVRKVQDVISKTVASPGHDGTERALNEAAERLELRVSKWIDQLRDEYLIMKREVEKYQVVHGNGPGNDGTAIVLNSKVFLVGTRGLSRKGLKSILERNVGLKVVGEASRVDRAITLLHGLNPHLVILHVRSDEPSDLGSVAAIKGAYPALKVLVLTEEGDEEYLGKLVHSGADAYLIDDCSEQTLSYAIEKVLKGETLLSPRISEILLEGWRKQEPETGKRLLTPREEEVLRLVAEGKSSRSIAAKLFISVHTVDRHRANIMAKLNLKKATDLVKFAIARGMVSTDRGGRIGK